jgi:hypothetical protein
VERSASTGKGDRVNFRIADAFLPDPETLREIFSDTAELEGTIVDFSDSGQDSRAFALVEVIQRHVVVLPVKKLRLHSDNV